MTPTPASVRDVAYTHGYYRELSPTMIAAALHSQGVASPDLAAPLNYFELGMGFGVSLLANAACFPHMRFFGNDFNVEHVAYARRLAEDAGLANVELLEEGFEELLQRELPPLDIIVMHGVYSWVSPAHRQVIADFIERRLKPGGVVYVSHNTLPGWAARMPLRQLVHRHAMRGGARRSPAEQLQGAVSAMQSLQGLGAAYFEANPSATAQLAMLAATDPHYAAHEYFNPCWQPQYVHEVADEMACAGLQRAAASLLEEHVDEAWLSEGARAQLAAEADPLWRETWRDVHLNQSFRRDLYTRGARRLDASEREARLLDARWALAVPREEIEPGRLAGRPALVADPATLAALLDGLSDGPVSLRTLLRHPGLAARDAQQVQDALMLLSGEGVVHPALPEPLADAAQATVQAFNAAALLRGGGDGLLHLACAATGQAVGFSVPGLLQVLGYCSGARDATALARTMNASLAGEPDALRASAERFLARRAPLLTQLGLW